MGEVLRGHMLEEGEASLDETHREPQQLPQEVGGKGMVLVLADTLAEVGTLGSTLGCLYVVLHRLLLVLCRVTCH